jgi:hypothetical protein
LLLEPKTREINKYIGSKNEFGCCVSNLKIETPTSGLFNIESGSTSSSFGKWSREGAGLEGSTAKAAGLRSGQRTLKQY